MWGNPLFLRNQENVMRQMSKWTLMIAFAALVAGGCVFDNGGSQNNESNNGADAGDTDEGDAGDIGDAENDGEDMSDAGDTEDDGDGETCEPITECAEDQCGTVDDGCGGTFDCATACPCQGGEAQQDTCGSCGLGRLECGADEDGFGTCVTPPIADDLACEDVLYVSSNAGADGDGTASSPFASYPSAFAEASAGQTIVIGGTNPLQTMIEVKDGVSVIGGYSVEGDTWTYDPEKQQEVQVPAASMDTFGLAAIDLAEDTVVYGLDITTADAADGGSYDNYGAYVAGTDTLTLEFVDVFAGRGGSGADGSSGAAGADGENGADATKGIDSCIKVQCQQLDTAGAIGGTNADCPSADGGAGGKGGQKEGNILNAPAEDGEDARAANGGQSGLDSVGARAGENGDDGPGFSQLAASGDAQEPGGEVSDQRFWDPAGDGEAGQSGEDGSGGGGGGGAAKNTPQGYDVGPGGAGGGAGGCGGEGGGAGEAGGGSFGLFAVQSDITLRRTKFNASAGGVGGDGAAGGAGGQGGEGGAGINLIEKWEPMPNTYVTVTLNYFSGDGGDGANGQTGGTGAGGAGGVSYGAFCKQSRLEQTDVEFSEGAVASGGTSPGADGREGLAVEMEGCQ